MAKYRTHSIAFKRQVVPLTRSQRAGGAGVAQAMVEWARSNGVQVHIIELGKSALSQRS